MELRKLTGKKLDNSDVIVFVEKKTVLILKHNGVEIRDNGGSILPGVWAHMALIHIGLLL